VTAYDGSDGAFGALVSDGRSVDDPAANSCWINIKTRVVGGTEYIASQHPSGTAWGRGEFRYVRRRREGVTLCCDAQHDLG
jgi:hypothetical protein